MPTVQLQEFLFQRIREKLPAHASLADVVADTLCISADSAYRRIRGETMLVLDEAKRLCDVFHLSLDGLLNEKPEAVSFIVFKLQQDFKSYLETILRNLQHVAGATTKSLIYLTKDIPVFYHFLFRPLSDFHYFFWMKSIAQHPEFVKEKFRPDIFPVELEAIGVEIMKSYRLIPSTEIWNTECVNSTISRIEYYREAGYFESASDVQEIYKALERAIDHIRFQAEHGVKFLPGENPSYREGNFQFFANRLVLADNTIVVTADEKKRVFLNYSVLNYMATDHEEFCQHTHETMQLLIKRATLLSETGDKQRNIFFNTLLKKLPVEKPGKIKAIR